MMPAKIHYPELWNDEDTDRIVRKLYDECNSDCDGCEHLDEFDDECERGLIFELWRKWHNAVLRAEIAEEKAKGAEQNG